MTTTRANTKTSETEALRADLELTRQHLADTVQELSRQLNVPRRIKDSATNAGHRAVQAAGHAATRAKEAAGGAGERAKHLPENAKAGLPAKAKQVPELAKQMPAKAKQLPEMAKQLPEMGRKHPRATAAVGGAVVLGVGATAWIMGRGK